MIQIVDKPYLYPQRCFFTGDGTPRPILDTGVNDTEGGRVYISLSFMEELARATGHVTLEEADTLRAELAEYKLRADAIPQLLERFSDDIRSMAAAAQFDLLSLADHRGGPVSEDAAEAGAGAGDEHDAPAGAAGE